MELAVIVPNSKTEQQMTVSDKVFAQKFNEPLVHQIVTAYLAGGRAGTKAQKNRATVHGSTKKPWRQKGTGRARAGTRKSPLWRSGGVVFAAEPRCYKQKVNKKMYRGAMRAILSELVRQDRLKVVENLTLDTSKTKVLADKLAALNLKEVLIVTDKLSKDLNLAAKNLPYTDVSHVFGLNPVDLINFGNVLMTTAAIDQVEEWLG